MNLELLSPFAIQISILICIGHDTEMDLELQSPFLYRLAQGADLFGNVPRIIFQYNMALISMGLSFII
jgi:hypothetical protein